MGAYLDVPSVKERDYGALKLFKKIKTQKCFNAFDEYYKTLYPK